MNYCAPIDFLIVTALEEELNAILNRLPRYRQLPPSDDDIRVYYAAELTATPPGDSEWTYQVVVVPLLQMGHNDAATATGDAIRKWKPRYVLLVGIAGGIAGDKVSLGDVLVADQIVNYEVQKLTDDGPQIRYDVHKTDPRLLGSARTFNSSEWLDLVEATRPTDGTPKRIIGPVLSGNKVVATSCVLEQYTAEWPKLIGLEMEASGAATACWQASPNPGFFMIRAVSDHADSNKNSQTVGNWRQYACEVAASYTLGFLRNGPVTVAEPVSPPGPF